MKNKMKIFGIIAVAAIIGLSVMSCASGGTLEIKNSKGETITAGYLEGKFSDVITISAAVEGGKGKTQDISNGKTASFSFDEDTDITWFWFTEDFPNITADFGSVTIEGGDTTTIDAKTGKDMTGLF
ncbi:MAG: hypothetical protein LBQ82_09075 [Treponema sp.]|jgi:hypothetical protein|nr:hypothetical protein [Treponema sp.]